MRKRTIVAVLISILVVLGSILLSALVLAGCSIKGIQFLFGGSMGDKDNKLPVEDISNFPSESLSEISVSSEVEPSLESEAVSSTSEPTSSSEEVSPIQAYIAKMTDVSQFSSEISKDVGKDSFLVEVEGNSYDLSMDVSEESLTDFYSFTDKMSFYKNTEVKNGKSIWDYESDDSLSAIHFEIESVNDRIWDISFYTHYYNEEGYQVDTSLDGLNFNSTVEDFVNTYGVPDMASDDWSRNEGHTLSYYWEEYENFQFLSAEFQIVETEEGYTTRCTRIYWCH